MCGWTTELRLTKLSSVSFVSLASFVSSVRSATSVSFVSFVSSVSSVSQCVTNTILMSEYEYEYIRVDFLWRIRIRIYSDPIF